MAGVKDLREAVAEAAARRDQRGERTVLFIDEIHRFNKAQQDALLPHVEAGTVMLIGATTENPSFEVNAALLSRAEGGRAASAVARPICARVIDRALADKRARAWARSRWTCPTTCATWSRARRAATRGARWRRWRRRPPSRCPTRDAAQAARRRPSIEEALQKRTLLYDKAGDEHYGVVSAFIKSMRGTDPDAAVYWMARMLEAGEDPLFVLRRMVIFAAEDVGNADPQALSVAIAALDAFRFVGLPEGAAADDRRRPSISRTAPKSQHRAHHLRRARKADVDAHGALPVPRTCATRRRRSRKQLGYGAGYQYPHDFEGHYVREEYLPEAIRGHKYYQPSDSGHEARDRRRASRSCARRTRNKKR